MAQISQDNRGLRLVVRYTVLCLIAAIFSFPLIVLLICSAPFPHSPPPSALCKRLAWDIFQLGSRPIASREVKPKEFA